MNELYDTGKDLGVNSQIIDPIHYAAIISWGAIAICVASFILFIISAYNKRNSSYRRAIVFSIASIVYSLIFLLAGAIASGEVRDYSYNTVNVSTGAAPVIILLINFIAIFWLIKDKRELPPEEENDDDDDWEKNWVNQDYDDDFVFEKDSAETNEYDESDESEESDESDELDKYGQNGKEFIRAVVIVI